MKTKDKVYPLIGQVQDTCFYDLFICFKVSYDSWSSYISVLIYSLIRKGKNFDFLKTDTCLHRSSMEKTPNSVLFLLNCMIFDKGLLNL